jgi:hypothetical protein
MLLSFFLLELSEIVIPTAAASIFLRTVCVRWPRSGGTVAISIAIHERREVPAAAIIALVPLALLPPLPLKQIPYHSSQLALNRIVPNGHAKLAIRTGF